MHTVSEHILQTVWGRHEAFQTSRPLFRSPYSKDHSILGSVWGPPFFEIPIPRLRGICFDFFGSRAPIVLRLSPKSMHVSQGSLNRPFTQRLQLWCHDVARAGKLFGACLHSSAVTGPFMSRLQCRSSQCSARQVLAVSVNPKRSQLLWRGPELKARHISAMPRSP